MKFQKSPLYLTYLSSVSLCSEDGEGVACKQYPQLDLYKILSY